MQRIVSKITAICTSLLLLFSVSCATVSYVDKYYSVFGELYMSVSYYEGSDKEVKTIAETLDAEINPDIPTSYVSRFNSMKAGEIEVSEHVYNLVEYAIRAHDVTGGAFDVTLSDLSKLWKVDHKSLSEYYPDLFPSLPSYELVSTVRSYMDAVSVREENGKYYLSKTEDGAKLDLGGLAKGYLSDIVKDKLSQNGVKSAIVDVSGNLCLLGSKYDSNGNKKTWNIGINNCFDEGGMYLCGVVVNGDSFVITSGTYERGYEKDGVEINHIINPETKMPVGVDYNGTYSNTADHIVSVTIIGQQGILCDTMATAICIKGIQTAELLAETFGFSAIIVTADKQYKIIGDVQLMQGNFYLSELKKI